MDSEEHIERPPLIKQRYIGYNSVKQKKREQTIRGERYPGLRLSSKCQKFTFTSKAYTDTYRTAFSNEAGVCAFSYSIPR